MRLFSFKTPLGVGWLLLSLWLCCSVTHAVSLNADFETASALYEHGRELLRSIRSFDVNNIEIDGYEPVEQLAIFMKETEVPLLYPHPDGVQFEPTDRMLARYAEAVNKLEQAAALNHPRAIAQLAELSMFGNFTGTIDFPKAFQWYRRLAQLEATADSEHKPLLAEAHYMLGFIYATGLFGELPIDQEKALLHYQRASVLGSAKASMVLGYRYLKGISVEPNNEKALEYYKLVAEKAIRYVEGGPIGGRTFQTYAARVGDFDGGYLGEGTQQLPNTLTNVDLRTNWLSHFLEKQDDNSLRYHYRAAILYYMGNRFMVRDHTMAISNALDCFNEGTYSRASDFGAAFHSESSVIAQDCAGLLALMFLRHEGNSNATLNDVNRWVELAGNSSDALYIKGLILEYGLLSNTMHNLEDPQVLDQAVCPSLDEPERVPLRDLEMAEQFYRLAVRSGGHRESQARLARLEYLKAGSNATDEVVKEIVAEFDRAGFFGSTTHWYYLARIFEEYPRIAERRKESAVFLLKAFVESVEPLLTNLEWAFRMYLLGNSDLALLGYAMAAEQGIETAESSVGYILARPPPPVNYTFPDPVARARGAIVYTKRSAMQNNVDSIAALGEMYYSGLIYEDDQELDPRIRDYQLAASAYEIASFKANAYSLWALGWMYEFGVGVLRDKHLAKRYYDSSLMMQKRAIIAVNLSLLRLALRSLSEQWFGEERTAHWEAEISKLRWIFQPIGKLLDRATLWYDRHTDGNVFFLMIVAFAVWRYIARGNRPAI